jgi:SH3 domain-containing YSC84-like protein 1
MQTRKLNYLISILCLALVVSAAGLAKDKNTRDSASQANKASTVLKEIMGAPDKAIPKDVLDKAECVAVFPQVIKAGFIIGGRGGRGVASCRTPSGWSAPAFFNLGGGSLGLQIGAQATDFIFLFMNEKGMESLLSSKFTLGGDASVAAGPVGRQAGGETDALLSAQVLSYSRSKGVFAGLELKGTVISQDTEHMEGVYFKGVTASEILKENKVKAPTVVQVFPRTLSRYSPRKAHR